MSSWYNYNILLKKINGKQEISFYPMNITNSSFLNFYNIVLNEMELENFQHAHIFQG